MGIASFSFLLCITRREQVAQIFGKPIYIIKDIALLPLSSQADADQAIIQTREGLEKAKTSQESDRGSSASEENGYESFDDRSVGDPSESQTPADAQTTGGNESTTSVVQDVIKRKGQYGRFASQWFSRRGWGLEKKHTEAMSPELVAETDHEDQKPQPEAAKSTLEDDTPPMTSETLHHNNANGEAAPAQKPPHEAAIEMLPKILRTLKLLFISRSFYYSYDFNISKRFGSSSIASLKSVSPEGFEQQVRESSSCSQLSLLTVCSISGTDSWPYRSQKPDYLMQSSP